MADGITLEQSDHPRLEVVPIDGEPHWLISLGGISVIHRSGTRALAILEALCRSRGVDVPSR